MMQQSLKASPTIKKRAKSVYHSRNLGTIKERKKEKKQEKEVSNEDTIMRILRMRYVVFVAVRSEAHRSLALQTGNLRLHCPATPDNCCHASGTREGGQGDGSAESFESKQSSESSARSTLAFMIGYPAL